MKNYPSEPYQGHIDFAASTWKPGFYALEVGRDPRNVTTIDFSLLDLAVLRAKIDELLGAAPCSACEDGRHADCVQYYADSSHLPCGCDNRNVHASIMAEKVTMLRLSRRRF